MNNRIKELAVEAFGSTFNTDLILVYEAEKFAELIVRECMGVVTITNEYYTQQWLEECKVPNNYSKLDQRFGAGAACLYVNMEIKKHFGVEE